jgi:hypothetical protein
MKMMAAPFIPRLLQTAEGSVANNMFKVAGHM